MPTGKASPHSRDLLIRDLPIDLADKLKVASSLHKTSLKDYVRQILEQHVDQLERKGITLTLGKGKGRTD